MATTVEELLRDLAPQILGTLVRRYGSFDVCEDAVQEALLAAAVQWPAEGLPRTPKGWLITVASRRLVERWRNESARRRREESTAALAPPDREPVPAVDDTLTLLLLCCHPSLTQPSQVALTLRAVGGLTTEEIARAFLVPQATIAQRISRAKQRIKDSGAGFRMPPPAERSDRITAVLHVLYLIFNEGYTASSGPALHRVELTSEAIRLTRRLHARLAGRGRAERAAGGDPAGRGRAERAAGGDPAAGEVTGLLALMLLTDARRPARTHPDGRLIPLADQDRSRWDSGAIAEGLDLISETLATAPIGPFQLQAAIAAVHDEASSAEDTDWPQILVLYDLLRKVAPGPMVTLNRIVAVAMVDGPYAGLEQLATAEVEPALASHHRVAAVRAHLLELAGDRQAARTSYELAARRTRSVPEQRYLLSRAAHLRG
jgi:RNA polymerase sigma factor (sigma-70 family)